eukprot:gb/GECG01008456.1/.p1 GENE.gb/GECG01008456.1/~~gb/GECG01008456.1/.p1  ORF type:complete len:200 (+),score=49.06 gb/GECG01008456.1/:1-600(+)
MAARKQFAPGPKRLFDKSVRDVTAHNRRDMEDWMWRSRQAERAIERDTSFSQTKDVTDMEESARREREQIAEEKKRVRQEKVEQAKEKRRHELQQKLAKAKEENNHGLIVSLQRRIAELDESPPEDVALPSFDDDASIERVPGELGTSVAHRKRGRPCSDESEDSDSHDAKSVKRKRKRKASSKKKKKKKKHRSYRSPS